MTASSHRMAGRAYMAFAQNAERTQLYIHGGAGRKKRLFDDLFVLEDGSSELVALPQNGGKSLPGGRSRHSMCVVEDGLLLFGGWDGRRRSNKLFHYSLESGEWTELEPNPDPHSSHAAALTADGRRMVVVGRGETGTHKKFGANVSVYDIATNTWSVSVGALMSRSGHCMLRINGALAVYGGRQRRALEYVPPIGEKKPKKTKKTSPDSEKKQRQHSDHGIPPGRSYHAAAANVIHGGFIEGKSARGLVDGSDEVWLCDEHTGSWRRLDDGVRRVPRAGHALARFASGRVVGVGGTHAERYFLDVFELTTVTVNE